MELISRFFKLILWAGLFCVLFPSLLLAQDSGDGMDTPIPAQPGDFYNLRSGDVIQITVFNEPELSVQQELDPDGVIIIPLLGRTNLAGLTIREAEEKVEELYVSQEYLIEPQVTIAVRQFAEQVFYIFGEVRSPGAKQFPAGKQSLDILEAITMAGDVTQYAKRSEVIIRRPIKGTDREERFTINLEKIIRGGDRGEDALVEIFPQDIIYVAERLF